MTQQDVENLAASLLPDIHQISSSLTERHQESVPPELLAQLFTYEISRYGVKFGDLVISPTFIVSSSLLRLKLTSDVIFHSARFQEKRFLGLALGAGSKLKYNIYFDDGLIFSETLNQFNACCLFRLLLVNSHGFSRLNHPRLSDWVALEDSFLSLWRTKPNVVRARRQELILDNDGLVHPIMELANSFVAKIGEDHHIVEFMDRAFFALESELLPSYEGQAKADLDFCTYKCLEHAFYHFDDCYGGRRPWSRELVKNLPLLAKSLGYGDLRKWLTETPDKYGLEIARAAMYVLMYFSYARTPERMTVEFGGPLPNPV